MPDAYRHGPLEPELLFHALEHRVVEHVPQHGAGGQGDGEHAGVEQRLAQHVRHHRCAQAQGNALKQHGVDNAVPQALFSLLGAAPAEQGTYRLVESAMQFFSSSNVA